MIAGHGVLLSFGQKVSDLQLEHFGQLGEVLWAGVAAARFPGVDVPIVDAECIADCFLRKPACLAGGFDGVADHSAVSAWASRIAMSEHTSPNLAVYSGPSRFG